MYRRAILIYVATIVLPAAVLLWLGIQSFERQRHALATPYMHDGSLATLEEVVDYYSDGGRTNRSAGPSYRFDSWGQARVAVVSERAQR
jgi:hypothetical protein